MNTLLVALTAADCANKAQMALTALREGGYARD